MIRSLSLSKKVAAFSGAVTGLLLSAELFAVQAIDIKPVAPGRGFALDVGDVINFVLRIVMIVAILLVFAYLIIGGIEWITSGGDKTKTESARNKITSAVIGLIILAASYAIFVLLLKFIGFKDINDAIQNVNPISSPQPQ